jgi:alanine racemase
LRSEGIQAPILLFGHCLPDDVGYMASHGIRASVGSLDAAEQLSREARRQNADLMIHVKIDTGMGRLGLPADALVTSPTAPPKTPLEAPIDAEDDANRVIRAVLDIARLPGLTIEGVYTHFAGADAHDKRHARMQLSLFMDILSKLEHRGVRPVLRHAANSAATIEMPETHLDMVRIGIVQYGLWPSDEVDHGRIVLTPVMTLKSTVIQVKDVPAGFKVSYGSTYETPCRTRIATVPVGYADGYSRRLSSRGAMLVRGRRAPILGRVCMDLTMIDVGMIDGVTPGDEVVVFGRQQDREISADDVARLLGTINYEIVSALTSRVARIYLP